MLIFVAFRSSPNLLFGEAEESVATAVVPFMVEEQEPAAAVAECICCLLAVAPAVGLAGGAVVERVAECILLVAVKRPHGRLPATEHNADTEPHSYGMLHRCFSDNVCTITCTISVSLRRSMLCSLPESFTTLPQVGA